MRERVEIENDIIEINKKIEALNTNVSKLNDELVETKRRHVELISKTAGQDHLPKSLDSQRSRIRDIEAEIESNKEAIAIFETELQGYEEELELRSTHDSYMVPYQEKLAEFLSCVDVVRGSFDTMIEAAKDLREKIKLIQGIGNPLGSLSAFLTRIDHNEDTLERFDFKWPTEELRGLFTEFQFKVNFMVNIKSDMDRLTTAMGFADSGGRMMSMLMQNVRPKGKETGPVFVGSKTQSFGTDVNGDRIEPGRMPSYNQAAQQAVRNALLKRKLGIAAAIRP